ncbi:MAG: L-serine ammonia-lyase, iron-sulfur-dependent, subunit alpha [Kiritimatiellia bacterium]|jgi:L-serine dehydratase|nr:L-serine ammonia-lyase, iron-sulfur-dependent, subunit alpha [Kiritimatiellia bacterium]
MKEYPSIFNDVLGPVMRGPSSSHSAAALRIGRLARDLMGGDVSHVLVEYDPNGSLVTTHESQGSDMGLFGGLLGWDTDDDRLPGFREAVEKAGLGADISYVSYDAGHPNNYRLTLSNARETRRLNAISTGGGMIVVDEVEGHAVHIAGDFVETLVFLESQTPAVVEQLEGISGLEAVVMHADVSPPMLHIKSRDELPPDVIGLIENHSSVTAIRVLQPVLSVLSSADLRVPFITCDEMLAFEDGRGLSLWELAVAYESARGRISGEEVFDKMRGVIKVVRAAIAAGIEGTSYDDRILPCQAPGFRRSMDEGTLVNDDVLNRIIMNVTAIMEVKSSMGVIVAAPTAGSCGALPGAVMAVADTLELDEDCVAKSLLAAGIIGVFIAEHATFSAEVGGCMAECGSASGMAAAAIVTMKGGTLDQALAGTSIALQNSFGMTCDPIANRVEAPCLGKNVLAATNALSSANMALAGYRHLVPLDEVIEAMRKVGEAIPSELCCTNLGGLSVTPTAKKLEDRLNESLGIF